MADPSTASSDKEDVFDYLFKIVVVGDASVGKTSLVARYADEAFTDNYICTIGVDFKIKTLNLDGKTIKLQLWDTAGQERFRAIVSAYYRSAHGVIIMYDVTKQEHFDNVQSWLDEVNRYAVVDRLSKLIVGTKSDLEDEREVAKTTAQGLADALGIPFFETSAKEGTNVKEAFTQLVREIKERVDGDKRQQQTATSNSIFSMPKTVPVKKNNCC